MSHYEQNRAKFCVADLQPYSGQWVAFSGDGSRILASAATLLELESRLVVAGESPEDAAFERIDFADCLIGGAELL